MPKCEACPPGSYQNERGSQLCLSCSGSDIEPIPSVCMTTSVTTDSDDIIHSTPKVSKTGRELKKTTTQIPLKTQTSTANYYSSTSTTRIEIDANSTTPKIST